MLHFLNNLFNKRKHTNTIEAETVVAQTHVVKDQTQPDHIQPKSKIELARSANGQAHSDTEQLFSEPHQAHSLQTHDYLNKSEGQLRNDQTKPVQNKAQQKKQKLRKKKSDTYLPHTKSILTEAEQQALLNVEAHRPRTQLDRRRIMIQKDELLEQSLAVTGLSLSSSFTPNSWYIPYTESDVDVSAGIPPALWKMILETCGYQRKDFAHAMGIHPSVFSRDHENNSLSLRYTAKAALISLVGYENFLECLGRWMNRDQPNNRRKFLAESELRGILKMCEVTLTTYAVLTPVSHATISRWFCKDRMREVPLLYIDALIKTVGLEDFTRSIRQLRKVV